MDTRLVTALIVIGLVLLIAIGLWAYRRRRSARLRRQFGPEYDRMLQQLGSRRRAEAELETRVRRVSALHVRELDLKDRARLAEAWRSVQLRFADDPSGAVAAADRLVVEAMDARGYPVSRLDQCVADISVHHAHVLDDFRRAREIASRDDREQTSTEDLRQAMIGYRALFEDLLGERVGGRQARDDRAA
ncbi:MAG TPA: hypothetical protein VFO18_02205 [Methylomirabilota bacterium]|nr:hypothetical protein [Methylomirabilota bacterium]